MEQLCARDIKMGKECEEDAQVQYSFMNAEDANATSEATEGGGDGRPVLVASSSLIFDIMDPLPLHARRP